MSFNSSTAASFITAVLTIAGIFITLFYTNIPTVFSNKYPSSSGAVPKLFVKLVSSDRNLDYCTSFVVVSSLSFVVCALQKFSWPAFVYVIILTLILVGKLSSLFSLIAGRTDMTAVSAIPANRFLSLARASSFDKTFFESDLLVINFKRIARNELALLDTLMDYSLNSGDYSSAYSKAVNQTILDTLAMYSRISLSIDAESYWHIKTSSHKAWFMSPAHELKIAISTGTIPRPEKAIDRLGYHRELYRISNKYGQYLVDNGKSTEYSNYLDASISTLAYCIQNGDIEWARDYSEKLLTQCRDYSLAMSEDRKEDLQVKLYLLEQYAVMLMTFPLELSKLCDNIAPNAFHFDSFITFSQAELQKQRFPLGSDKKMRALCRKVNYEKAVFDTVETPKWWFNKKADSFGLEAIEQLCSQVLLLHDRYCSDIKSLVESDPKSSYILALKEAELFNKSKHCIFRLLELAESLFNSENLNDNYYAKLESAHDELVRKYPDLAKSFLKDNVEFEDLFPDLYGFAFFNFCQLLLEDIINDRLPSFCASITPLHHLAIISSLNLQEAVSKGSYNDIYKAQVLLEPTIFFLELCGMAYVMAELQENAIIQQEIISRITSIAESSPNERSRWAACVAVSRDFTFNGKISMDLYSWREKFLDAVKNSEHYPDAPRYPFNMDWKPPANKKRLLEMLPMNDFDCFSFNGCQIYNKYILGNDDHDL